MPNPWVQHVREFAELNKITYGCAVSNLECRESYHRKKALTAEKSQLIKRIKQARKVKNENEKAELIKRIKQARKEKKAKKMGAELDIDMVNKRIKKRNAELKKLNKLSKDNPMDKILNDKIGSLHEWNRRDKNLISNSKKIAKIIG